MGEGWEAALFSNIYLSPIQAEGEPFHPKKCVCVEVKHPGGSHCA